MTIFYDPAAGRRAVGEAGLKSRRALAGIETLESGGFPLTRKALSYATLTTTTKALDASTGEVEAIANTLGVVDAQLDVMHSQCWADVISKMHTGAAPWPTLCWGHEWTQPVGKVTYAEERGNGLYIKGRFNLNTTRGKDAYEDVKFGSVRELSVGFMTANDGEYRDHKGVRHVTKVAHWPEVSFVLVGASPNTGVLALKDGGSSLSQDQLDEIQRAVEDVYNAELTRKVFAKAYSEAARDDIENRANPFRI